jgi:hypothetical protein
VGGQYELGSINDKWEKKGAGKDKEKIKPKWSGEFKGKAGASVGFELKISVKGTVGGSSDSKKPSSTGKSQTQPRSSAPKCDASNCPKGK